MGLFSKFDPDVLKELLKHALEREVLKLIDESHLGHEELRGYLEQAAYAAIARVGIKRSSAAELIVHLAVEAALTRIESHRFRIRANVQDATDKLDTAAQGVLAAFDKLTPPQARDDFADEAATRPVFEEVRQPDKTIEQVYGNDPDEPAFPGLDSAQAAADKVRAVIAKGKGS